VKSVFNKIGSSILLLLIVLMLASSSYAQDLHFSQFFNSPLTENPANTGFIPNHNYRVGANYRKQWASVGAPYKTFSAYGDAQLLRNRWYYGWLGVGGVLLQDNAGNGALKTTEFYLSIAYHQLLGQNSLLSVGFNSGYVNRRLDVNKITFPDQFNDEFGKWFFDQKINSGVKIDDPSIGYFDMQMGMNYAYFPTDKVYLNLGFSVHHLNQAKMSFLENGMHEIKPRYIGFFNAVMKVAPRVIIHPGGYYSNQSGANETVLGTWLAYDLSHGGEYQLLGGAYYRFDESSIPMVGYQLKQWRIMFSYDVTTSSLGAANQHRGGYELSLTFIGDYINGRDYNKKVFSCPHF